MGFFSCCAVRIVRVDGWMRREGEEGEGKRGAGGEERKRGREEGKKGGGGWVGDCSFFFLERRIIRIGM